MAINTLRAAELLSDDSNFRGGLIPLLAPTLASLLTQVSRAEQQEGGRRRGGLPGCAAGAGVCLLAGRGEHAMRRWPRTIPADPLPSP